VLLGVLGGAIYLRMRAWRHRTAQALLRCEEPPTEAYLLEPQLARGESSPSVELSRSRE
jgi:hypothetical protein